MSLFNDVRLPGDDPGGGQKHSLEVIAPMTKARWSLAALAVVGLVAGLFCGPAEAAGVRLELKLKRGQTFYQRTLTEQRVRKTTRSRLEVIELSCGVGRKLEVVDVDPQGNATLECTYLWSAYRQSGDVRDVYYDSSRGVSHVPKEAAGFAALLGGTYVMTWTPRGEVLVDANALDDIREAVRRELPENAEKTPAATLLAPYLDETGIEEAAQSQMPRYPDEILTEWFSWSARDVLSQGLPAVIQSKWTMRTVDADGLASIDVSGSVGADPDASIVEIAGMELRYDFSGTRQGGVQIDTRSGLLVDSTMYQRLEGDATEPNDDENAGEPRKIFLTFESQVTLNTKDKKWDEW